MENGIVNLNGTLFDPAHAFDAKVSVFDRSFLYGDSLYEVLRTYRLGIPFALDEHLERLSQSAKLCKMRLERPLGDYRKEILRTIDAHPLNGRSDFYCRIVLSRGAGKIGFALSSMTSPSLFVIYVFPIMEFGEEQVQKGLDLQIARRLRNDRRALDPAMKSGNYLNSLLAYLDASEEGHDDAVLCNEHGFVTEGTTFNVFYVKNGVLVTSPLDIGILDGITRRRVLQLAREDGLRPRELFFPSDRLLSADEVFATSTLREVFPVTRINGRSIAGGKPGEVTLRLRARFRADATGAARK